MVKQVKGDLIKSAKKGEFDVIAHQANCFNTMGSGIALSIKNTWPEASDVDNLTKKGDIEKLGTISFTKNTNPIIVNLYGQFDFWSTGVLTNYDALEKSLVQMKKNFPGKKIGMPKIGSLRARGDWSIILPIIEKVFCDATDDVTIVEWDQNINPPTTNSKHSSGTPSIVSSLSAFSSLPSQLTTKNNSPQMPTSNTINKKKFHGTRKCKVCNTSHPIREMNNYLPAVWICKQKCNEDFINKVCEINNLKNLLVSNTTTVNDTSLAN